MVRPQFINGEIYHLYNRGVEKRNIVQNDKDRLRIIHDLFSFNDVAPTLNNGYRHETKTATNKPRKLLVEIFCFCIMPNHYHLLVRQLVENGITLFMRKSGTGYTNYFNKKYDRVGPLFQGKFKAVLVKKEQHVLYLPHYIHLNPLDLSTPEWRSGSIQNIKLALDFLESYRWSSYADYIGKNNFPSLTQRDSLLNLYKDRANSIVEYRNEFLVWLKDISLDSIEGVLLENY